MTCTGLKKIDSNVSGLRIAEESECIGQLPGEFGNPGTAVWFPFEPNSYADFGGSVTTVARNPINDARQLKKGVVTDFDASGGFNSDLTQTNMQDILQGYFFADTRKKTQFGGAGEITGIEATNDEYEAASGLDAFAIGSLIFVEGFVNAANNGIHLVSSSSGIALGVVEDLLAETPPTAAKITLVGFESAAGDFAVSVAGSLPALTSSVFDFTTLNMVEGETFFIGGDDALEAFDDVENNGFKRARAITTNAITIDKSDAVMLVDAGGGSKTIRIFVGHVLKNEQAALIKRRTYQLERTLGAPDPLLPAEIQSEIIIGSVPSEFTMNIATADKVTVDLSFVSTDHQTRTGPEGLKAGTRPSLVESDGFNTSSDFSRIRMAQVSDTNEAPTPLFAFVTDMTNTINNNVTPNKAIGVTGAFEVTAGNFQVNGSLTAYFASVDAITSVKNNDSITLDYILVKENKGISWDLPLLSLGDARANIEQDQPITLPISMDAASAAIIDPNLDYTAMFVFYDFLPNLADTN